MKVNDDPKIGSFQKQRILVVIKRFQALTLHDRKPFSMVSFGSSAYANLYINNLAS